MGDDFKVAILQLEPIIDNSLLSLKRGIDACRESKQKKADIAVFPEMWNIGYEPLFKGYLKDQQKIELSHIDIWYSKAISIDSTYIRTFMKLAKELDMAICLPFMEKTAKKPRNLQLL